MNAWCINTPNLYSSGETYLITILQKMHVVILFLAESQKFWFQFLLPLKMLKRPTALANVRRPISRKIICAIYSPLVNPESKGTFIQLLAFWHLKWSNIMKQNINRKQTEDKWKQRKHAILQIRDLICHMSELFCSRLCQLFCLQLKLITCFLIKAVCVCPDKWQFWS